MWALSTCDKQGLLIVVASLAVEPRPWGAHMLQQLWLTGSTAGCMGLVALQHVGYSQTRDRTCVPCIGRWILHHWTNREVHGGGGVGGRALNYSFELPGSCSGTCHLHGQLARAAT